MPHGPFHGREAPLSPSIEVTLDSARTPWAGLRLFVRQFGERGHSDRFRRPDSLVAVINRGQCAVEIDAPVRRVTTHLYPGSLFTMPPGYFVNSMDWTGAHEETVVTFSSQALLEVDSGSASRPILKLPMFGRNDIIVENIIATMRQEIEQGCASGKLFAESLSVALLGRVASPGCCARVDKSSNTQSTFTALQRQRIQAYIDTHLSDDIGLADLASVVDVSAGHFARVFRNTYAMPPYQYVIQRRIEEAKRLMAKGNHSILEIALTLGFSSQSHFTAAFRKVTGTTPRRFQSLL